MEAFLWLSYIFVTAQPIIYLCSLINNRKRITQETIAYFFNQFTVTLKKNLLSLSYMSPNGSVILSKRMI